MDASRQEYSSVLVTLPPPQAATILNERMRHVSKLNNEIADWLQERRQVEEAYVQGMSRLFNKQPPGDFSDLGTFATPWTKIVNSTGAIAESHSILARKIENDVEKPLREFATSNREVQAMAPMQGNLGAIAKEYDGAMKKATKIQEKSRKGSTDRFANASSDVDAAKAQWDSQAPSVFENLQVVDESRFNNLRDLLTQFQTLEVDQVERSRVAAEQCLNTLLNLDTADEIKAFAIRASDKRRRAERPESRTAQSYTLAPTASVSSANNDLSRDLQASQEMDPGEVIEDKKTGRLKRLGTVFGRRRSATPNKPPPTARTKSLSKLGSHDLAAGGSSHSQEPPVPAISEKNWRAPSPGLISPSAGHEFGASDTPTTRGVEDISGNVITNGLPESQAMSGFVNGANQSLVGQLQQPLELSAPPETTADSTRDAEGFTVPTASNDPISVAQQEAASSGETGAQGYNVNIRDAPIQEEGADNATALANVASTLRAAAPSRRNGTLRGRRDVRNTVFLPSTAVISPDSGAEAVQTGQVASSVTPLSSPPNLNFSPKTVEENLASDNQSVRSGMSLGQSVRSGPAIKHPEMSHPGLNCSIIETVSAWFEQGRVVKASVLGELALIHNSIDSSAMLNTTSIRLENFQILEKVAPNPAFVLPMSEKPGEYTVDTSKIVATEPQVGNIAFKYQLHISPNDLEAHAPLLLTPTWKVEATQASMILSYALNPAYSTSDVTLSNVLIVVHLDTSSTGVKAISCQSKPTGTFARAQNLIYWRLGDITLSAAHGQQKLLARFQTPEGEAKPGNTEARWELADAAAVRGLGLSVSSASATSAPDPFADDSTAAYLDAGGEWQKVECLKKLVSGTYNAI